MDDAIVVLNAGSSSLKFSVFIMGESGLEFHLNGQIGGLFTKPRFEARRAGILIDSRDWSESEHIGHKEAIEFLFQWGTQGPMEGHRAAAAGHRVVHGGLEFTDAVRIDDEVIGKLEKLVSLAPLHQPYNLAAIRASANFRPDLLQVACFDTSFHRTIPAVAQGVRHTPLIFRGRCTALWVPWSLLRVHQFCFASVRPCCCDGTDHCRPPGQWRQHVRHQRGQEYRQYNRVQRPGWTADGHPLWRAGPRSLNISYGLPPVRRQCIGGADL